MKSKLNILLVAVLLFTFATADVAKATEVTNGDEQVSVGVDLVDGSDGLDAQESGADNGGESATETGNGVDGGGSENLDPSSFEYAYVTGNVSLDAYIDYLYSDTATVESWDWALDRGLVLQSDYDSVVPLIAERESVSEPSEEPSELPEWLGGTGDAEDETEASEPSETVVEPSDGAYSLDGATVNVSEESIMAIADAVNADYEQVNEFLYSVPLTNGKELLVDTNIEFLTSDYHFLVIDVAGTYYVLHCQLSSANFVKNIQNPEYYSFGVKPSEGSGRYSFGISSTADPLVFKSAAYTMPAYGQQYTSAQVLFNNRNVLDDSGNIYLEATIDLIFKVSFDTGFDDLILNDVSSLNFVTPTISYDGFEFDGWYLDSEFTLPYSSDYTFVADTTLYAKWIPYRAISFVTGLEGVEIDSIKVLSGQPFTCPAFSYPGYTFVGCYLDNSFERQFVDGTVVSDDITLYINFEPIVYDTGALLTEQVELSKGLQIMQSQLWIILVVGLLYFVYRFFRIFF